MPPPPHRIFGLRIEGASTSTSPSIDSDTTSNATAFASQFPKFKEVVKYDGNGRLIIAPDGVNGFILASSGGHMIIEAIKPFYTQPWGSWNEIKLYVRVLMWNQFVIKLFCRQSVHRIRHKNEIQRIFKFKAALRIKEHLYEAQRSLKKALLAEC
ncbi:hypothetical protein P3L10_002126 [Capsicum annuum]